MNLLKKHKNQLSFKKVKFARIERSVLQKSIQQGDHSLRLLSLICDFLFITKDHNLTKVELTVGDEKLGQKDKGSKKKYRKFKSNSSIFRLRLWVRRLSPTSADTISPKGHQVGLAHCLSCRQPSSPKHRLRSQRKTGSGTEKGSARTEVHYNHTSAWRLSCGDSHLTSPRTFFGKAYRLGWMMNRWLGSHII